MSEELKESLFDVPKEETQAEPAKVDPAKVVAAKIDSDNGLFDWQKGVSKENQDLALTFEKADDLIDAYNQELDKSKANIEEYKGVSGKEYQAWQSKAHKELDYKGYTKEDAEVYKSLGLHPHIAKEARSTFSEMFKKEQDTMQKELQAKGSLDCKALEKSDPAFNSNIGAVINSMGMTSDKFKETLGKAFLNRDLMAGLNKVGADIRSETLSKVEKGESVDKLPNDIELLTAMYIKANDQMLQPSMTFVDKNKLQDRLTEIENKVKRL